MIPSNSSSTITTTHASIADYEGYSADSDGHIWSSRSGNHIRLLKTQIDKESGYPLVYVKVRPAKWKLALVHHLVALAFHGPRPAHLPHIRHLNGIKTDNRPTNLAYGTPAENGLDRIYHSLSRLNPDVTREALREVIDLVESPERPRFIAERFGIPIKSVYSLRQRLRRSLERQA